MIKWEDRESREIQGSFGEDNSGFVVVYKEYGGNEAYHFSVHYGTEVIEGWTATYALAKAVVELIVAEIANNPVSSAILFGKKV